MADWVEGPVAKVIDGDTFEMRVEWIGKTNSRRYNDVERIRLAGIDAPEAGARYGATATERLRNRIGGKHVCCTIQARDTFGRLVCQVKVVPKRMAG